MPVDTEANGGASEADTGLDRRRFLQATGAATVGGVAGLAGCTGGGGNKLTIGLLNPLTGPYAALGKLQRQGAELAIKQAKDSGDYDFDIETVKADTEGDTTTATQKADKLVNKDGANFLTGAVSSSVALSLNSFAQKNETFWLTGAAAVPITGSKCNEWSFRSESNAAMIAEACAPWTLKNLSNDVWFHIADYAYGQSVLKEWRSRMKANDATYNEVGVSRAKLGASNYSSYISKIKDSDAEVAVIGATGGDLINFLKQADSQGLQEEVDVMTTTGSFLVIRKALGKAADGIYSGVRYNAAMKTGDNQEFVSAFKDEYDAVPNGFASKAYDGVRKALDAAQAGEPTASSLKDTLPGRTSKSVLGDNAFRKCDHQLVNPVWVGQDVMNGGKMADVKLIEKKTGKEATPPCSETNCSL